MSFFNLHPPSFSLFSLPQPPPPPPLWSVPLLFLFSFCGIRSFLSFLPSFLPSFPLFHSFVCLFVCSFVRSFLLSPPPRSFCCCCLLLLACCCNTLNHTTSYHGHTLPTRKKQTKTKPTNDIDLVVLHSSNCPAAWSGLSLCFIDIILGRHDHVSVGIFSPTNPQTLS